MKVAYQRKQWQFNDIITEGELNRMEEGIEEGITKAEQAGQVAQQAQQTANQAASDLASHLNDIATTPGANKIPRADALGKLDPGWLPDIPACRVYATTSQSVSNNGTIAISFSNTVFDNDNIFNLSNPTRLTCNTPGLYLIIGQALWGTESTSGARQIFIRVNGTLQLVSVYGPPVSINGRVHQVASTLYNLSAGDYVELLAKTTDAGRTVSVDPGDVAGATSFMMVKVG